MNEWYEVPSKKGRRHSNQKSSSGKDPVTKFFVSNLPERCASSDLIKVLNKFSDIQGMYIARKYDRLGKRFGFASFKNVRNITELEGNLRDVWIGSYKLFIVLARFVDGMNVTRKEDTVWKVVKEKDIQAEPRDEDRVESSREEPVDFVGNGSRSFRDTLINKEPEVGSMEVVVNDKVQDLGEWFEFGLLGRVKDFGICKDLVKLSYC